MPKIVMPSFGCVQTGARQQRLALQDLGNCFVDRSHMSFYNFLGVDITRVIIKVPMRSHEVSIALLQGVCMSSGSV